MSGSTSREPDLTEIGEPFVTATPGAEDLDRLPEAPRHTELVEGALVFTTPRSGPGTAASSPDSLPSSPARPPRASESKERRPSGLTPATGRNRTWHEWDGVHALAGICRDALQRPVPHGIDTDPHELVPRRRA
ncbi:hypothetical protein GCM10023108_10380 [Saccharopolyspora hordei]